TVMAESPVIDVRQSMRSTYLHTEQIELLPHNRDFTSLLTQAPGVNFEAKSTNDGASPMIDGSSAAENRYIVDGMETTSLFNGLSAKPVIADFLQEVQIKSSGYEAEYGGSTGGVVNVLTKSGTNRFSGSVLGYWQGSAVNGSCARPSIAPLSGFGATTGSSVAALPDNSHQPCGANPTLRLTIANSNVAEYWTYPKDQTNRYEPGFSLGGPIRRDKAWFFAAYQPTFTNINRTVNAATSGNRSAASISRTQKQEVEYLTTNETMQLGDKLRTRVAFNNSWNQTDGQLPSLNGTDLVSTNYSKGSKFPNWSLSGVADYAYGPKLLLSLRAGYFRQNQHDYNVSDITRYVFGSSNLGQAGVPLSEQHGSGFTNIPSISSVQYNILDRRFVQGDATWF